jgi:hypothetical protein
MMNVDDFLPKDVLLIIFDYLFKEQSPEKPKETIELLRCLSDVSEHWKTCINSSHWIHKWLFETHPKSGFQNVKYSDDEIQQATYRQYLNEQETNNDDEGPDWLGQYYSENSKLQGVTISAKHYLKQRKIVHGISEIEQQLNKFDESAEYKFKVNYTPEEFHKQKHLLPWYGGTIDAEYDPAAGIDFLEQSIQTAEEDIQRYQSGEKVNSQWPSKIEKPIPLDEMEKRYCEYIEDRDDIWSTAPGVKLDAFKSTISKTENSFNLF